MWKQSYGFPSNITHANPRHFGGPYLHLKSRISLQILIFQENSVNFGDFPIPGKLEYPGIKIIITCSSLNGTTPRCFVQLFSGTNFAPSSARGMPRGGSYQTPTSFNPDVRNQVTFLYLTTNLKLTLKRMKKLRSWKLITGPVNSSHVHYHLEVQDNPKNQCYF